ncbi:uncharacterized protein RJT21DRAFT_139313 [Scheffersomyces amazonensis]|uniref:uncharacterized protein n=1 Tax=Scheffersomyces amazonensis TaxID=1078765 RepID=UPI00315C5814
MNFLQHAIHELRYKVDYYFVDYRQRYYSTNRNPRLIQTKLQNQQLISLRTFPKDKYLLKPGQFLSLEYQYFPQSMPSPISNLPIQSIPKDDAMSFLSFDETFSHKKSRRVGKGGGDKRNEFISSGPRINSAPDLSVIEIGSGHHDSCTCQCHSTPAEFPPKIKIYKKSHKSSNAVRNIFNQYLRPIKSGERNQQVMLGPPLQNLSSDINIPSDSAPDLGQSNKRKDIEDSSPLLMMLDDSSPLKLNIEINKGNPDLLNSNVNEIMLLDSNNNNNNNDNHSNHNPIISQVNIQNKNSKNDSSKSSMVWKTVLNDVSLSAARISTGSPHSPNMDARRMSADFTDAKSIQNKENDNNYSDLFAMNLAQAKVKYGNQLVNKKKEKGRLFPFLLHSGSTNNGQKRNISNVSTITPSISTENSVSGTVALQDLYGDNGILSIYDGDDDDDEDDI